MICPVEANQVVVLQGRDERLVDVGCASQAVDEENRRP